MRVIFNKKDIDKDKEKTYIIRKTIFRRIIRVIIWILLIFIFFRGVVDCLRPNPKKELNDTINDFRVELSSYKTTDSEALAFAQNFAIDYLTYKVDGEDDYVNRLKMYAANSITNIAYKFTGNATVLYAEAYRKEEYTATQLDVWVLLNVSYQTVSKPVSSPVSSPMNTVPVTATTVPEQLESVERTILKVPIRIENGCYIVEDLPVFVSDDIKISDFKAEKYSGKSCSAEITEEIKGSLSNFFKAYYEEPQSVINYYLAENAEQGNFKGLNKRVIFNEVTNIQVFHGDEDKFIAIVTVTIIDKNGNHIAQNYNLEILHKDKYYIVSMNARSMNLEVK